MAMRTETNPLEAAYAALLSHGLDGAGEALRILVDEASKIERSHHLQAAPHERSIERNGYANGFKPKTVLTRMGEITFAVPQVRDSGFYPSALEKGSRTEQAVNLALAEMYVKPRLSIRDFGTLSVAESMQSWVDFGLSPKSLEPLSSPACHGQSQHMVLWARIPERADGKHLVVQRRQRVVHL